MKFGDRLLQRWRISKARKWITNGSHLLDIGCADGAIFLQLDDLISGGTGIDPDIQGNTRAGKAQLIRGRFPRDLADESQFDAITMLAVLEHIPADAQQQLSLDIERFLKPGGRLIVTVLSPLVDQILVVLKFLRIVDTMNAEEHYGYQPAHTPELFCSAGLKLISATRFQLGLNHLFVFERG